MSSEVMRRNFFSSGFYVEWSLEYLFAKSLSEHSPCFQVHDWKGFFRFSKHDCVFRLSLFITKGYYNGQRSWTDFELEISVEFATGLFVKKDPVRVVPGSLSTMKSDHRIWSMSEQSLLSRIGGPEFLQESIIKFSFIFRPTKTLTSEAKKDKSVKSSLKSCLDYHSDDFGKLLDEGSDYDVVLKCGERTIQAHKTVLCARSKVFTAMLRYDMVESRTNCIALEDMDDVLFQEFVRYLYSGKVAELKWDTARKLFAAGDKYSVEGLKKRCAIFLGENLTPENACEALYLADAHNDSDLKECSIRYILDHKIPLLADYWLPFSR